MPFGLATYIWASKYKLLAHQCETPKLNSPNALIQNSLAPGPDSSGTHEFIKPFVSHCCATHFRLLVQTKVSKGKDTRHGAGYAGALRCSRRRDAARTRAALAALKQAGRTGAMRRTPFAAARLRRRTTGPNTDNSARYQVVTTTELESEQTPALLSDYAFG